MLKNRNNKPPKIKCEGCNELHNEFFWHCAQYVVSNRIVFGNLATCIKCKTLNYNEEKRIVKHGKIY